MNRIAIISVLFGCLFLTSGCIEVSYKTEAKLTLGGKKTTPVIVDNGYPNSTPTVSALQSPVKNRHTMSPIITKRKRGFTSFKKRER